MPSSTAETLAAIESFLENAVQPMLIEAGEREIPIVENQYSLQVSGAGVQIHAWPDERSYVRKVTSVKSRRPGRIELNIWRLGKPEGTIQIIDVAHGRSVEFRRRGARERSREEFRFALGRQFPDWKIQELTTAPDLENSLSPAFPRALLRRGSSAIAAIFAAPSALDPDGVLSFGLIWLNYVRRREPRLAIESLALFLPKERSRNTALRLRWLDSSLVEFQLWAYAAEGEQRLDRQDWGNLVTKLDPAPKSFAVRQGEPEAELQAIIRGSINTLDAALRPSPVYRQAPAIAAADRGIMDLVAVDHDGRLAVLELKATQDIHLPLQALDYWMRVKWHLDRGDFTQLGYFPKIELLAAAPILYLVAPALEFHPTNETVLRFFSRAIPVVRLGVGANWREELKVILRQESVNSQRRAEES